MKKTLNYLIILLASFAIVACSSNRDAGMATGAVAGGVVGAAVTGGSALGTIGGAVAGTFIGGAIGQSMDDQDRAQAMYAMGHNPANQPMQWVNPRTGMTYIVVPGRYVTVNGNPNCRKYYTISRMSGKKQRMVGVACPMANGMWEPMMMR